MTPSEQLIIQQSAQQVALIAEQHNMTDPTQLRALAEAFQAGVRYAVEKAGKE